MISGMRARAALAVAGMCILMPTWLFAEATAETQPAGGRNPARARRDAKSQRSGAGFRSPKEAPPVLDEDAMRALGDRRRSGPGGPDGPLFPVVTEKDLQELRSFVKEHFPEHYERLAQIKESDPELLRRTASRIWPKVHEMIQTCRRNPELGKLMIEDQKIEEKVRRRFEDFRDAPEDAKPQIREGIQAMMAEQFDIRQKRRAMEIAELERRLADQKRMLEERSANKESIIAKELERRLHPEMEF